MAQRLSNLPIGAKIKFGKYSVNGETAQDIIWLIVAKNHSGYPTNAVTLLTERVIDFRAFDGNEGTSRNTHYSLSNIDQWLNKSGSPWYVATHEKDVPPAEGDVAEGTEYVNRPGFLTNFTEQEKAKILTTTIKAVERGYIETNINRKVFLPSWSEVGASNPGETLIHEGSEWAYFMSNTTIAYPTQQSIDYSRYYNKSTTITAANWYWLRTIDQSANAYGVRAIAYGGDMVSTQVYGGYGLRPALNLSATDMVSDTTDSSGCYTVVPNTAPPTPTTLNVPTVYGGKSTTISWSGVTDPDGQAVTYQLEQSIGGAAFTTLYTGTNLAYTTIVPFGTTNVQFRVKAIDTMGASSEYKTSSSITVINNYAPVVDGSDSNLGTKTTAFSHTYKVTDANSNTVTVTEAIDGVSIRSYTATLGATNTFSVTGNTWLTLANGIHTMTITASDGIDRSVRTFTFTKSVTSFTVQRATAIESSVMPTRIKVSVMKTIPVEATFKVEVCNNGFDASPTWEDATSVVESELIYAFKNTTKTSAKWGVNIRVTVNRNNGSGACYITSIGGNWE